MSIKQDNSILEQGKSWLKGEIEVKEIELGGKLFKFTDKQKKAINSKARFLLMCGGFSSGKTVAFVVKLILLSLWFPRNLILLGRKNKSDVEATTLQDFMDMCPPEIYEYKQNPGQITFFNGSKIVLFGLDALQEGNEQEIKKAMQKIKGLNLGGVFIDQLEEIEFSVFEALDGRLRRNMPFVQFVCSTNPENYWAYDWFKANPRPFTELVEEMSMYDLLKIGAISEDFVRSQEQKPESYVKKYVKGIWEKSAPSGLRVFPDDYLNWDEVRDPIRIIDGCKIYEEPSPEKIYQVGVDPSDGAVDPSSIKVFSQEGEEAAEFHSFVPIRVTADKTIFLANLYSLREKARIVPEANAAGIALLENIKDRWDYIYTHKVQGRRVSEVTEKLGFYTDWSSKKMLIDNFQKLLENGIIKIRSRETLEELRNYIWTSEVKKKGAGADKGSHDDRVMASMLACWDFQFKKAKKEFKNVLKEQLSEGFRSFKKKASFI